MRRMITNKQIEIVDLAESLVKFLKVTEHPYDWIDYEFNLHSYNNGQKIIFKPSADAVPIIEGIDNDGEHGIGFFDSEGDAAVQTYFMNGKISLDTYYPIIMNSSEYVTVNGAGINLNGTVDINGGLQIGTETMQFKLCDKDTNTPICNANWTQLSPNFPSQFDDDGRPLFLYKINNGTWGQSYAVSSDFLISKDGFNTLAPTKLGFYNNDAGDYFTPYNISNIAIMSTYGNTLTYTWDNNQYCFVIDSFTPLTGTQIGSIDFNIGDTHKPVYFEL